MPLQPLRRPCLTSPGCSYNFLNYLYQTQTTRFTVYLHSNYFNLVFARYRVILWYCIYCRNYVASNFANKSEIYFHELDSNEDTVFSVRIRGSLLYWANSHLTSSARLLILSLFMCSLDSSHNEDIKGCRVSPSPYVCPVHLSKFENVRRAQCRCGFRTFIVPRLWIRE